MSQEQVWQTTQRRPSRWRRTPLPLAPAGRRIRRVRAEILPTINGGLRGLYRMLEVPGRNPLTDAHAALDAAVLDAYGFTSRAATVRERSEPLADARGADGLPLPDGRGSDPADLLEQILDLNLTVARRIDRGEPVTVPGVPPSYDDPAPLITDDCIEA